MRLRLDRFISHASGRSRREAREWIREGRVSVDGRRVRDPGRAVGSDAHVTCDGERQRLPAALYLMMHKPCGLLSATRDRDQLTVLSLLPDALAARLHLVGRLDKGTSGLLLLTDDGNWSHRISSPRHHCPKVYVADLAEPLIAHAEQRLADGVMLRNEAVPTRPAQLQRITDKRVRIQVTEGRYHLVRRLFAALGNRVTALHRERIGGLQLDPRLAPGEWRELDSDERDEVCSQTRPR